MSRISNKFWRFVHSFNFLYEWNKYGEFYILPSVSIYKSNVNGASTVAYKEIYFRFLYIEFNLTKYNTLR